MIQTHLRVPGPGLLVMLCLPSWCVRFPHNYCSVARFFRAADATCVLGSLFRNSPMTSGPLASHELVARHRGASRHMRWSYNAAFRAHNSLPWLAHGFIWLASRLLHTCLRGCWQSR